MGLNSSSESEQDQELLTYSTGFLILLWLRICSDMDPENLHPWLAWAAA